MENAKNERPGILIGAVVGLLLTAPLMALLFLADQLAGLPFVPFDLFDTVSRSLPGGVITFAIDLMVDTIGALNLGRTDTTAKAAEQITGLAVFLLVGVVAGVVFFALMRRQVGSLAWERLPGVALGLVVGIPMVIISFGVNTTATASPLTSALWIVLAFIGWGIAINWIYGDLSDLDAKEKPQAGIRPVNRRQFLVQVGGATATLTVLGAGLGALFGGGSPAVEVASGPRPGEGDVLTDGEGQALPNTEASLEPAPGTRPEYTPLDNHYRIDISSRPPVIEGADWVLPITGMVENPVELTLDDLRDNFEPMDQYVTLSCISNRIAGSLISTTRWTGVSFQKIMDEVKPLPEAGHVRITSADGFDEVMSLETAQQDERVMLAYDWDGQPLKQKHGFPLRVYIPDRYGMKQPKWITAIEFIGPWEEGYWVRRGWDENAFVRTTSVIDTVAVDALIEEGDDFLIPIGGIAYAGAKGISAVEVQIDDGEWVEAELRDPLSDLTWVVWRYNWPFQEGEHTVHVRCRDGRGVPQVETVEGNRPSGATGIHSVETVVQSPAPEGTT